MSVMLVCSPGGHLLEMRELAPAWEGETVSWVTLPGADVDDQREHPDVMRSMTWDQVGEMVEAGTEIGAHTMTHPRLSMLHGEELRQQLVDSRKAVIDRLGSCDLFAYPFGDLAPETVRAVADAGYRYAFAQPTAGQATHTRFTIPRIPVDARDDERRFGLKLHAPVRSGLLSPLKPAAAGAVRRVLGK